MATHHETGSSETSFGESDLITLGQKLAALDLTDPERAALGALIADDDVVGFGQFDIAGGIRIGLRNVRGPGANPGIFGVRGPSGDPNIFGVRGPADEPGITSRQGKPGGF